MCLYAGRCAKLGMLTLNVAELGRMAYGVVIELNR